MSALKLVALRVQLGKNRCGLFFCLVLGLDGVLYHIRLLLAVGPTWRDIAARATVWPSSLLLVGLVSVVKISRVRVIAVHDCTDLFRSTNAEGIYFREI